MGTTSALLPEPRQLSVHGGSVTIDRSTPVAIDAGDPRVERAVLAWLGRFESTASESNTSLCRCIVVCVDGNVARRPGEYRLSVSADRVLLRGASPAACFDGLQTLIQLSRFELGEVPCCDVVDWPSFATRGLLHDVTRGKVPTIETLKMLVDRLAMLKINQLQLNIEHAFAFAFDPTICNADAGLTVEDVGELDRYCQDRFIDLVPALATLGHMGRILSMPGYRHLAEVPPNKDWAAMSWGERMRGHTLNCAHPEARRLVGRMWSDILDAFSSPVVNICCDEPHDLGKSGGVECHDHDIEKMYLEHVNRVHGLCAARGRRAQVWCDVLRRHPHVVDRLPQDMTLLHWGYDDQANYDGTATLVASGLETMVCPGTSGWKRPLNDMNAAERNITRFARVGEDCGATGLINTDWGDDGHVNLLGCSWHGIALGAACAWRADHPAGASFDTTFVRRIMGTRNLRTGDSSVVRLLREASDLGGLRDTWSLLRSPIDELAHLKDVPGVEHLRSTLDAAVGARKMLATLGNQDRLTSEPPASARAESRTPTTLQTGERSFRRAHETDGVAPDPDDWKDLSVACELQALALQKLLWSRDGVGAGDGSNEIVVSAGDAQEWAARLTEVSRSYANCWRARNKESGLGDILAAFGRACGDMRERKR